MKRFLVLLSIALALLLPSEAARRRFVPPTAVASVLKDTTPSTAPSDIGSAITIGDSAGEQYLGSDWTASSSYTLTQITAQAYKTGTGQPMTCYIYSNSSLLPGTLLATSTTSAITPSQTSGFTSANDVIYAFAGLSITNTTVYFVVFRVAATSGSNRNIMNMDNGAPGVGVITQAADVAGSPGVFTNNQASRKLYIRIYGF